MYFRMSTISFTAECLATMSYREMQQLCKQNSLKASGTGADLKARLEDFLREERMLDKLEDVVGAGKDALSDVSNNADSPSNAEKTTTRSAHHVAEIGRNYVGTEAVLEKLREGDFESKAQVSPMTPSTRAAPRHR